MRHKTAVNEDWWDVNEDWWDVNEDWWDILYSFCQEKKVRKNKIFKNNELKIDPLFGNTSPSDSVHGFVFDFDEFLANNEP